MKLAEGVCVQPLFEDLSQELINRAIRPSYQRLKILEYLTNNQSHPTVDQIFQNLHLEIPTLSKATVYNTLNA
jgi:Fur family transcriptional regulator, peroxide stress response regulator